MVSIKRLKDRLRGKSPKPPNEAPQRDEAATKNKVIGPSAAPAASVSSKPVESSTVDAQLKDSIVERNLWQEAYNQIGKQERDVLSRINSPGSQDEDSSQSPTITVVEDVIHTTEKRYQGYQEGGVKIRRSSGKDIDIRGSCRKIIDAALSFKDVISAV